MKRLILTSFGPFWYGTNVSALHPKSHNDARYVSISCNVFFLMDTKVEGGDKAEDHRIFNHRGACPSTMNLECGLKNLTLPWLTKMVKADNCCTLHGKDSRSREKSSRRKRRQQTMASP